ncbi:MAG TPA: AAA family ATPase, partial [Ruminococcaceae bacterium]|nr:AAA family ATPase [Oscillospiraceae bacterium]
RESILKLLEVIRKSETANLGIVNYDKGSFSTPLGVDVAIDKKIIMKVLRKAKYIKEGSFSETDGIPVLKVTGNIDLAEEVPVPNIDPDIQYPHLQKDLAQRLNITPYEVGVLVWKFKMKGTKKFHLEVTTSKSGKVHKFSDMALQFLAEKINSMKDDSTVFVQIKNQYRTRRTLK